MVNAAGTNQSEKKGQVAKVISLSGTKATVKVQRHTSCRKCGACNLGIVSNTEKAIEVENTLNVHEGDYVMLGIKSGALLSASFILYLIPLLTFFAGLVAGNVWGEELGMNPDVLSIILGATFLLLTFFVIYIYDKRISDEDNKFKPYITRIINEDEVEELVGEDAIEDAGEDDCH